MKWEILFMETIYYAIYCTNRMFAWWKIIRSDTVIIQWAREFAVPNEYTTDAEMCFIKLIAWFETALKCQWLLALQLDWPKPFTINDGIYFVGISQIFQIKDSKYRTEVVDWIWPSILFSVYLCSTIKLDWI